MRLIDIEAINWYDDLFMKGENHSGVWVRYRDVEKLIRNAPTVDAVPVCRCAECKHRPTKPEKYDDGFDLAFPDEVCPCYCDGDPFYSWYPKDDWFCPKGERKGGTSDNL